LVAVLFGRPRFFWRCVVHLFPLRLMSSFFGGVFSHCFPRSLERPAFLQTELAVTPIPHFGICCIFSVTPFPHGLTRLFGPPPRFCPYCSPPRSPPRHVARSHFKYDFDLPVGLTIPKKPLRGAPVRFDLYSKYAGFPMGPKWTYPSVTFSACGPLRSPSPPLPGFLRLLFISMTRPVPSFCQGNLSLFSDSSR